MTQISPQAIDQASNRARGIWQEMRYPAQLGEEGEGIYSWLCRMVVEARVRGEKLPSGKFRYAGMKLAIDVDPINGNTVLRSVERVRNEG